MAYVAPEPFSGRRGTDPFGGRFLLDPTKREFLDFFSGREGAAFIRIGEHVAFGSGTSASIDHSTCAERFALDGEERMRGYVDITRAATIEFWTDAADEASMDETTRARMAAWTATALADPCLTRIATSIRLLVFNIDDGQPIVERDIRTDADHATGLAGAKTSCVPS